MTNPEDLHQRRQAWAIRMARVGMPDYQIAFDLGISMEEFRLNFAAAIQRSQFYVNSLILDNLIRQSLSFQCSASTRFWVKHQIWLKSELKNSRKSNEDKKKQTWGTHEPEDIIFRGPNGETE
jgi:hypothetical protein